jgi:small subunit ribosomal protein S17
MTETTTAAAAEHTAHGHRRKMVGKVVRDKMDKTVTVEVVSSRRDPLYGKSARAPASRRTTRRTR